MNNDKIAQAASRRQSSSYVTIVSIISQDFGSGCGIFRRAFDRTSAHLWHCRALSSARHVLPWANRLMHETDPQRPDPAADPDREQQLISLMPPLQAHVHRHRAPTTLKRR